MGGFKKELDPEAVERQATGAATVAQGLKILDSLRRSPKLATVETYQVGYTVGLANLTARATREQAEQIAGELARIPVYTSDLSIRTHHCRALAHCAKTLAQTNLADGLKVAALIPRVSDYPATPELQIEHACGLAQVGFVLESPDEIRDVAVMISEIPLFSSIGNIQVEYAKLVSNFVAYGTDPTSCRYAIESLVGLTGFEQVPELKEIHARAERNYAKRFPGEVPDATAPTMWTARAEVIDQSGQPVAFPDLESALFFLASDEAEARAKAILACQTMLERSGHRVEGDRIDDNLRLRLLSVRPQ